MPYQPADIPEKYKNTIDDLLLAILNALPVPNGNAGTVLNGTFNWVPMGEGGGASLPAGTQGQILVHNGTTWEAFPDNVTLFYDSVNTAATLSLKDSDKIVFGVGEMTKLPGSTLNWSEKIKVNQEIIFDTDILFPTKLGDDTLKFASRNTTGAEARIDIVNVSNINDPLTDTFAYDKTTNSIISKDSYLNIVNKTNHGITFKTNNTNVPLVVETAQIRPGGDNLTNFGSTLFRWKIGYFSDTVSTPKISHDGGTTKWSISAVTTGAVTVDTTRHIPIVINGTTYKLIIAQ